jgi:hypothetical protein
LETEGDDSDAIDDAEVWDREEEICDERFEVAEIIEISKDEVGTVDEGQQVEWSLEEIQELLDEVSAESTREDSIEENGEPMDDAVHESQ